MSKAVYSNGDPVQVGDRVRIVTAEYPEDYPTLKLVDVTLDQAVGTVVYVEGSYTSDRYIPDADVEFDDGLTEALDVIHLQPEV